MIGFEVEKQKQIGKKFAFLHAERAPIHVALPVPACVLGFDRVRLPVSRNAFQAAFPSRRRVFGRWNRILRVSEPCARGNRVSSSRLSRRSHFSGPARLYFQGRHLLQYVNHVRYAAHYTARSAAFPPA
ncbi:hypothetical protein [Burkholderia sp. Leaf177]|uniref:hypothetical protein n=1 Tax=Burkholderia sp. Leaf177 TaxID=1736287 RepID=UPI0012E36D78|nr:hypothetical protein [Burkholderia sp. Leaf177]